VLHSAALMKANWSCTACGMYSGRRYCVQRHIDNIHKGKANAIPFVEYLVGRREGLYPPNARPSYGSAKQRTVMEKTEDEVEKTFAQRTAESILPAAGDRAYLPAMIEVLTRIKNRQHATDWGEFFQILEFLQINSKANVVTTQGATGKEPTRYELLRKYDKDLEYYMKKLEPETERMPNSKKMKAEKDSPSNSESQQVANKQASIGPAGIPTLKKHP
jgi:hypothetical protein